MKEIILINDDSKESMDAARYAFNLACIYNKNIVLANVTAAKRSLADTAIRLKPVAAGYQSNVTDEESPETLADQLNSLGSSHRFQPDVRTLDASGYSEREMIAYINAQKAWMVVRGVLTGTKINETGIKINMQTILNRIQCPVMLVPENPALTAPERLVYLADLRYSQIPVINYLAKFRAGDESVILAHICAKGMPEIDKAYATDLFNNGLSRNVLCRNLYLMQLHEKRFSNIVDSIIHGMHGHILVISNHSYHFEQMLGNRFTSRVPAYLTIPLLIFPH